MLMPKDFLGFDLTNRVTITKLEMKNRNSEN